MKRIKMLLIGWLVIVTVGCGSNSGDRVLVAKYMYDSGVSKPKRFDVVVFRFPKEPLKNGVPTNYIKRLLGLAGETIAIFFGQLFFSTDLAYPEDQDNVKQIDLWEDQYAHINDPAAVNLFRDGKFRIIRKSPTVMMALRRIVYDNDHHAKDLKGVLPPRWNPNPESGWKPDSNNKTFTFSGDGKTVDWLRYQHILRPQEGIAEEDHQPQLVKDFLAYNSRKLQYRGTEPTGVDWVGDLMLELELEVEESQGEFWIELACGVDRFHARWDLTNGMCRLVRLQDGAADEVTLATKQTSLQGPGTYKVIFANFDQRLTVWVNRELPFGDGHNYDPPWRYDSETNQWLNTGPTDHDKKPASIGSKGAVVEARHLKLWRDTYYTTTNTGEDQYLQTMYVQPGHYLCLGDNSPESADSRIWGLVPQRLLLGRALVVYFPLDRISVIH